MKRFKDKSRRTSLFLLAIFVIIVGTIISVSQIYRIVDYSKKFTIESYEEHIEDTINVLKQNVENVHQNLLISAFLLGQDGDISKEKILGTLPRLIKDNIAKELSVVDLKGHGYTSIGECIDVSNEDYFQMAKEGQEGISNIAKISIMDGPLLIYGIPIQHKDVTIGVLVATIPADLSYISENYESDMKQNLVYILNKDNDIVFSNQMDSWINFNYNNVVSSKNYFNNNFNDMNTLIYKDGCVTPIETEGNYIWLQKSLGINEWSILIGKTNIINPISYNFIKIMNIVLLLIIIVIITLFLLFISTLYKSRHKMMKAMHIDPITGGYNWYKFRNDVNRLLRSRQFYKKKFVFVNFDINRFKVINDSFGYQKGDEVLKEIYEILKLWVDPGELYTRYAADQYYLLLSYQTKDDLEGRLTNLNYCLHQSEYLKYVKFYFGVFFVSEVKDSVDRMGDFATVAKEKIKGMNDFMISYFDEETRRKVEDEERIEKRMYDALNTKEFLLYLQPKISVDSGSISGAEALVRWKDDNGQLLSPGYFIPIFEKNGFITQLDLYMLRKICETLKEWQKINIANIPISVNMSRIHFANPNFANIIEGIVDEYNIPHELVELELTESAFLQNKKMLIDTVEQLRNRGFTISMDDFGSGYSSLNALKDIPLDVVKLDGELFRITEELERGLIVIRNTISMAKELKMKVVAECIETKEQVDFLSEVGCDIIQGYYFAKPMPVQDFEEEYVL